MTPNLDAERDTVWRMFFTTHTVLIDLIEQELAQAGLPPLSWYYVLLALSEAPEQRLRMHELASAIVLDRSNLTRLLDRLATAGLVCRKSCRTDRRGAFAAITEEGNEMRLRMWPVYEQTISKYFGLHLTDVEVEVFTKGLQRIQTKALAAQSSL
jgi:DNA-binding MarR family transcriptional regulator